MTISTGEHQIGSAEMTLRVSQLQWADTWDTDAPATICLDFDEDCKDVPCKTTCWLYQPERGICPYLAAASTTKADKESK